MPEHDPWNNRRQVAEALGVSERTVTRLVNAGQLPATRVGSQLRIRTSDLEAYLAAARINPLDAA